MDIDDVLTQEERDKIATTLADMIAEYKSDPQSVIASVTEESMSLRSDEAPEFNDPEPTNMDEVSENARKHSKEHMQRWHETPATPRTIQRAFHQTDEERSRARKSAASSKHVTWAEQEVRIEPGVIKVDGKDFSYKLARDKVNWGKDLSEDPQDLEYNLELIRKRITDDLLQKFGGAERITEIVIASDQLVVNRVMYVPVIDKEYVSRLPLDIQSYMENGLIAPLFNYRALKAMSKLGYFNCDSSLFYNTAIADDLGLGRRIGAVSLFKICPSLQTLVIAGESVSRENVNKPASKAVKKAVDMGKRGVLLADSWMPSVYKQTAKPTQWLWKSTKNWVTHRGNRSLFKYCGGAVVLFGLTTAAVALNAPIHALGGALKLGAKALIDAQK